MQPPRQRINTHVTLLAKPQVEPITVTELKAYLHVDDAEHDSLLTQIISSSREKLEAHMGVALLPQTWRVIIPRWPNHGRLELPRGPLMSIEAFRVIAEDGQATSQSPSQIRMEPHALGRTLLGPSSGAFTGGLARQHNTLNHQAELDVTLGMAATPADLPTVWLWAVMETAAQNFEQRGVEGRQQGLPKAVMHALMTQKGPKL